MLSKAFKWLQNTGKKCFKQCKLVWLFYSVLYSLFIMMFYVILNDDKIKVRQFLNDLIMQVHISKNAEIFHWLK